MLGCPQKNEFLKDLKEFLKTQTLSSSTSIGYDEKPLSENKSNNFNPPELTLQVGEMRTKKLLL
jgi:hypothetical protein